MATVWFWFAVAILSLTLLGAIPGIREIVRPLITGISAGVVVLVKFGGGYALWFFKPLLRAHRELFRHLLHSNAYFNPSKDLEDS